MLSTAMWNRFGSSYHPYFTEKNTRRPVARRDNWDNFRFPELLIYMLKTNSLPIMLHFQLRVSK